MVVGDTSASTLTLRIESHFVVETGGLSALNSTKIFFFRRDYLFTRSCV